MDETFLPVNSIVCAAANQDRNLTGAGQRSRSAALAKRIAASGNENVLRPPGCKVRCINMSFASKRRLSKVLWKPDRIAETSMSSVECPCDVKCRATGRSQLVALVERTCRCSRNLSPRRLPVSPIYSLLQARHLMTWTTLLLVHVNLSLMVIRPPGLSTNAETFV